MFKATLSATLFLGFVALAVLFIFFDGRFTLRYISDALFVSGGAAVLINLLILTRAGELTYPIRYVAGKMRQSRNSSMIEAKYESFFEYSRVKQDERSSKKSYNIAFFVVGILLMALSFILISFI